jgi:Transcription factor WhiB
VASESYQDWMRRFPEGGPSQQITAASTEVVSWCVRGPAPRGTYPDLAFCWSLGSPLARSQGGRRWRGGLDPASPVALKFLAAPRSIRRVEPYRAPDLRDVIPDWHDQAACRESDVEFLVADKELGERWPGSPSLVLPMLVCLQCRVRRECLAEALRPMPMPSDREPIFASGIWGATTTAERRLVRHLPVPEAVDTLERELPERVTGHVQEFHTAGHHRQWRHPQSGKLVGPTPRARRIVKLLTGLGVNTNGHGKASQSVQEPSTASV